MIDRGVLGKVMKIIRRGQNLSVAELAGKTGISKTNIYKIERGDIFPRLDTIELILGELGGRFVIGGNKVILKIKGEGGTYEIDNGNIKWLEDALSKTRGFEPVKDAPADTKLPARGSGRAAGYNFYAPADIIVPAKGKSEPVYFNVKAYMLDDEVLCMRIRSGLATKHCLALDSSSVIDADYYGNETNDGNIATVFRNNGNDDYVIKKGERCCQGIFLKNLPTDDDISLGARRGGHGSSGEQGGRNETVKPV